MNWMTAAVLSAVAVWFEYSYQRSRRKKAQSESPDAVSNRSVTETAHVATPDSQPSIVPGDENDKQMNAAL